MRFSLGRPAKPFGNEVARWNPATKRLELKLPRGLRPVVLENVRFASKVEEDLRACTEARTPVSWRVKLLAKGKVELCVTYEEPEPPVCTDVANGALALDLNAGHIAATLVSGDGRLLDTWRWDLRPANDNVQNAARLLTLLAAARGVPVIAEDLDFRRKKAWLKQYGRRFAEVLSLFRSKQVLSAVERQCRRRGVELIVVDPGWTTKIAKKGRYPDRYRIGLHHAAALVIGRRGLGFAERVPTTASPPVRAEVKRRGTRWLGEHARAVAARRTAPGPSARHHHQAGGPKGPCRDVLVPARWACGCRGKSGCRCPGESDLCPYSRLICNGLLGHTCHPASVRPVDHFLGHQAPARLRASVTPFEMGGAGALGCSRSSPRGAARAPEARYG